MCWFYFCIVSGCKCSCGTGEWNYGNQQDKHLWKPDSCLYVQCEGYVSKTYVMYICILRILIRRAQSRRFPIKTLIWFTLTVIFIGTNVLSFIFAKCMDGVNEFGPAKYALFMSFRKLYYVNSIVNPIVYFILDQTFRKASLSLVRKPFTCFND